MEKKDAKWFILYYFRLTSFARSRRMVIKFFTCQLELLDRYDLLIWFSLSLCKQTFLLFRSDFRCEWNGFTRSSSVAQYHRCKSIISFLKFIQCSCMFSRSLNFRLGYFEHSSPVNMQRGSYLGRLRSSNDLKNVDFLWTFRHSRPETTWRV